MTSGGRVLARIVALAFFLALSVALSADVCDALGVTESQAASPEICLLQQMGTAAARQKVIARSTKQANILDIGAAHSRVAELIERHKALGESRVVGSEKLFERHSALNHRLQELSSIYQDLLDRASGSAGDKPKVADALRAALDDLSAPAQRLQSSVLQFEASVNAGRPTVMHRIQDPVESHAEAGTHQQMQGRHADLNLQLNELSHGYNQILHHAETSKGERSKVAAALKAALEDLEGPTQRLHSSISQLEDSLDSHDRERGV